MYLGRPIRSTEDWSAIRTNPAIGLRMAAAVLFPDIKAEDIL
jgi:hypothetical protein